MAKRNPEITARNKQIKTLTKELDSLLLPIFKETSLTSKQSINGKIGGKFADYIDIKNEIIHSPDHFIDLWLTGFKKKVEEGKRSYIPEYNSAYLLFQEFKKSKHLQDYLYLFLKRTYLRNYDALSKKKPKVEDSEIWIGQQNASYGIFVTPRFKNGEWENDKSEIRHFQKKYWSIGHIMETGLVIPNKKSKVEFSDIKNYLTFFKDVLVRNSGSSHEYDIAEKYCDFVINHSNPEDIPLLIPEFRYGGKEKKHKHRLDFTIVESSELNKIGFELSPWSTHGYLRKTKSMTQKEINKIAQNNFEKEMKKHKAFFKKFGIFVLIHTDEDLANKNQLFNEIKAYLEPKQTSNQLKFYIWGDFFK